MRLRILFGTIGLVAALALYGLGVAALAARVRLGGAFVEFVFYAAAGLAWIPPAGWLVRWMQRAPPFRPPPAG